LDYFREWTLDRLAKTIENEQVDIIAHPTLVPLVLRSGGAEVYNDAWKADLIKLASINEVAFEINHLRHVPDEAFLTECVRYGINVSLGSGGRTRAEVGCLDYPLAMVQKLEIPDFIIFPNNTGDAF
jgi:histidinol phosphatase-like PHP family hydrolase